MPLFAQTGKPDFVEPEPTYAVPFGQIQEAQLIIQSQGGPSKCVSLSVLYMKDEGERIVPSNPLVVKDDKCKDIADGASETFAITIDPTQLQRPGKYKARLLIKKGEKLAESKAMVTLIRGEPRLESSAPKKVVVTKWLPWSQGAEHKDIAIREVSGLGGAARVSLSADSFLGPDKATLYPGNIDLEFIDIQGNQRLNRSISPNEQLGLRMSISGVTRTGELTTKIVLTSPSLKEPFLIPLTIVARDHGFWAFLTILGGVLMSWVAFRWAEQIKPRYQLELQIGKLNDEIIECKTTSQNPAKLGLLEGLIVDLDEARS